MKTLKTALICAVALVAGCHTPKHSNVLVFATNTKIGMDIGYDPKTQEPSLVVGFRRQEGVWMPLLPNRGEDGLTPGKPQCKCCNKSVPNDLYQGNKGEDRDTYSVIASIGAKFTGKGGKSDGVAASGGLAQFFATGLAARELAKDGRKLVALQPSDEIRAREEVKAEVDEIRTTGRAAEKSVNAAIDVMDKEKFIKAVNSAKTTGLIEDSTATELTTLAGNDVDLKKAKAKLKEFTFARGEKRVKMLQEFQNQIK